MTIQYRLIGSGEGVTDTYKDQRFDLISKTEGFGVTGHPGDLGYRNVLCLEDYHGGWSHV